jgi:hypothetical protein
MARSPEAVWTFSLGGRTWSTTSRRSAWCAPSIWWSRSPEYRRARPSEHYHHGREPFPKQVRQGGSPHLGAARKWSVDILTAYLDDEGHVLGRPSVSWSTRRARCSDLPMPRPWRIRAGHVRSAWSAPGPAFGPLAWVSALYPPVRREPASYQPGRSPPKHAGATRPRS